MKKFLGWICIIMVVILSIVSMTKTVMPNYETNPISLVISFLIAYAPLINIFLFMIGSALILENNTRKKNKRTKRSR